MKYYRTTDPASSLTLGEALMCDSASDDGIVLADKFPVLPKAVTGNLVDMTLDETAYIVLSQILGHDIQLDVLNRLLKETFAKEYTLRATSNPAVSAMSLISKEGIDIYSIASRFYMSLTETTASHRHNQFRPIFTALCRSPFQESMCRNIDGSNRRVLLLPRHDQAEEAIDSIRGCKSRRLYIMALAGTADNRTGMIEGLFSDSRFVRNKQLIVARQTNLGAYLPVTVLTIHAAALAERQYPGAGRFNIVFDRYNPELLLGAAVAAAMQPQIRVYAADDLSKLTPDVAEAIRKLGLEPTQMFLSETREKELLSAAKTSEPVVIIETAPAPATETAGTVRHRFYHVVRNLDILKKEIEIIK